MARWESDVILFGGDYSPEQWPQEVWDEDVRLMKEAGVNLAIVGIFSWARLEPHPGARDFGWLDEIIDLLHANGVGVALATPTASPPPWMGHRWPETLPCYEDGIRMTHSSRNHYCMSSPVYRDFAARLVADLAERYGSHPAVKLWHVNNEYGTTCHCDECGRRFQIWLRRKYETLEALNESWGTAFWSQGYDAWEEIPPPRRTVYHANPALQTDYRRFCSDALLECFTAERDAIRAHSDRPVWTNFQDWERRVDGFAWGREMDLVGLDLYPDPAHPEGLAEAGLYSAMVMDLARGEGEGRPWLLTEQAPSGPGWMPVASPKRPGLYRFWSLQAVARGSESVLNFQWRSSRQGTEKFHIGMVPHAGEDSRVFRESRELGQELATLDWAVGTRVSADVAILHSWESWWAAETEQVPSDRLRVMDQLYAWYAALWRRSITVDFAPPSRDLSGYKLVLVPNLYLVSDADAAALVEFVRGGGTAVIGPFSGVVDPDDRIGLGGYPAPWREMLGVRVEEFWPLREHEKIACESAELGEFTGTVWGEWLTTTGSQTVASAQDGPLAGRPLVTRNRHGEGTAWYVATCPDARALDALLHRACADAGAEPVLPDLPPEVEAVRRGSHVFVFDYRDLSVRIIDERAAS